ncbi:MAG: beta strand repeat-containing protein [Candidatus Sericytochromatia bacterium]
MAGAVGDVVCDAAGAVGDVVGDVAGAVGDLAGSAAGAIGDVAGAVTGAVGDVAGAVGDLAGSAAGAVGDLVGDAAGAVGDLAGKAAGAVGDVAGAVGDLAGDAVGAVTGAVSDVAGAVGDLAGSAAGAIGDVAGAVGDLAGDAVGAVTGAVSDVAGAVGDLAGSAAGAIGDVAGAVGDLAGSAAGAIGDVAGAVGDLAGDAVGAVTGAVSDVAGAVGDLAGDAVGAVTGAVSDVAGAVGDLAGSAAGAIGDVAGAVGDLAGDAVGAVTGAVSDVAGAVGGVVSDAAGAVGDVVGGAASAVGDVVGDVAGAVGGAVSDAAGAVGDVVGGAASAVGDVVSDVAGAVGGVVSDAAGAVSDAVGGAVDAVGDVVGSLTGTGGAPAEQAAGAAGVAAAGVPGEGGPEPVLGQGEGGGGIGEKLKGLGSGLLDKLKFATGIGLSDEKKEERQAAQASMKELAQLIEKLLEALGLQKATGGALGDISHKLGQIKDVVTKGEYKDDNGQTVEGNALAAGINSAIVDPLSKVGKAATQAVAGAIGTVAAGVGLAATSIVGAAGTAIGGGLLAAGEGIGKALGVEKEGTAGKAMSDSFGQIGGKIEGFFSGASPEGGAPGEGAQAGLDQALAGLTQGGAITDESIAQFTTEASKLFEGATNGERLLSQQEIGSKIGGLIQAAQQGGLENLLKGAGVAGLGPITAGKDGGLNVTVGGKVIELSKDDVKKLTQGGATAQSALGGLLQKISGAASTGTTAPATGAATPTATTGGAQVESEGGGATQTPAVPGIESLVAAGSQITQLAGGGVNIGGTAPAPVPGSRGGQTGGDASAAPTGGLTLTGDQAKLLGTLKQAGLDIGISKEGGLSLGGKAVDLAQLESLGQLAGEGGIDLSKAAAGLSVGENGLSLNIGGENGATIGFGEGGKLSISAGGKTQEGVSIGDAKGALANLSSLASSGALANGTGLKASLGADGGLQIGTGKGAGLDLGKLGQGAIQSLNTLAGQGVNLAGAELKTTTKEGGSQGLSVGGSDAGTLSSVVSALGQAGRGASVNENGGLNLASGGAIGASAISTLASGIEGGKALGTAQAVLGLAAQGANIQSLALGTGLGNKASATGDGVTINGNTNLSAQSVGDLLAGGDKAKAVTDSVKTATNPGGQSSSPSTASSSPSSGLSSSSKAVQDILGGTQFANPAGNGGGSTIGNLFKPASDSFGQVADSFKGTNNPIVGLFTGDNANAKDVKDIPGTLLEKGVGDAAKAIKGDLQAALKTGDRSAIEKLLTDNGLIGGNTGKTFDDFVKTSKGENGKADSFSFAALAPERQIRNAIKSQFSVSSTQGENGNTFSLNRNTGSGPAQNLGSVTVAKSGQVSGTGEQASTAGDLSSGQLNNRRTELKDAINGVLRKSENDAGLGTVGYRVKASDLQLDDQGNLAGIKVEGKSLTLDQFAQVYGQGRNLTARQTGGIGSALNSAVEGAISKSNASLQTGGSDNKIGNAVSQALASFKAAGAKTEGAQVTYSQDGNATITLASGESIGVDQKGQLFGVNKDPQTDPTTTTPQKPGAFGQQLTTTSANGGIIAGQEATLQKFLGGPEALAKFTGNQKAANDLKAQLDSAFKFSLFSGREGGDAVGASAFGAIAHLGTFGLGALIGEGALRLSANQDVSKIDFAYDEQGNINGANVDFGNGSKLSLGRNTDTGQYNVRGYQSGTVDNSKGLVNFLNGQRKGQVEGALKGLGIGDVSISTKDNPNLPLSDPSRGASRPDGNTYNDGFAQESLVNFSLGDQKFEIGIDYDRNGGTFVNFDGLSEDQRKSLAGAASSQGLVKQGQDKITTAIGGQAGKINDLLKNGKGAEAQALVNSIIESQGLRATDPNGKSRVSVESLLKDGAIDLSKVGPEVAKTLGTQADALGFVRGALGGKAAQLSQGQVAQAEGDFIKSVRESGFANVRFATSAIAGLADNKDFQALAGGTLDQDKANTYRQQLGLGSNATQGDIAKALLRQAEKSSGLNVGVFQVSDLKGKTGEQARKEFGSVDLSVGYDGRVSKITANNIEATSAQDFQANRAGERAARTAVENLTQDTDFQALATGQASDDTVNKYRKDLGVGFEQASQGEIAQALLNRSIQATGVSPINSEGKAVVNVGDLVKTESGRTSMKGAAGIKEVLDQSSFQKGERINNITIRQDPSGRRTVEATGAPEKLQENLKKNFPENEGPSKFKKTVDGIVKGLGESLPELMKALQALKKAMEDLQEAQIKLAAAKKQYNAALKYAAEMGVTADVGGAGGGPGGGAGGVGSTGMAGAVQTVGAAEAGKGGGKGGGPEQAGKGGPEQAGKGGPEETGKGGATPTVDENGNPITPGEVASELLSQVASDAGFANMSVLLGLQPGLLIAQAQQEGMIEDLAKVIKQLQSPNGDPIQEMQRFLDQLKQRTGVEATPPSDMIPFAG